ncbi:DUF72 domain-containing protein [Alkalicoccus chagannorensis]|uniref:DUF72 domain-containing protein n=1 Tax=Alkalicoccus chagannorensis TaxID=427072 RepID=UPI000408034D|nr:DUF72 domain-containing protein [Alkalicoccus chagannorensis]
MVQPQIGLTGWGDHTTLHERGVSRLSAYASHFPVVELDASFYAVPAADTVQKWIRETPDSFQFIVKAYQGMTGHQRGENPFSSAEEMLAAFRRAFLPMQEAGKLAYILCQFPPWFDCSKKHVDYLKRLREAVQVFPAALEFRHRSWYEPFQEQTLAYMKEDDWIHTVCDEPQIGERSVPFVPEAVHRSDALIRLHGRNKGAWQKPASGEDWRKVRYLYDYRESELKELIPAVERLQQQSRRVSIIFNNNSGGHAAGNAFKLQQLMNITYTGLHPKQLPLFGEDETLF